MAQTISLSIVQDANIETLSEVSRFRVKIAGILIPDLIEVSGISESTDVVQINEYRVDNATVVLRSSAGKYNEGIPNNFWTTNNLTSAGYQEPIEIFKDSFVNGAWVENIVFSGFITSMTENLDRTRVTLTCADISEKLRNISIEDFGNATKWAQLRQESDESTYQTGYVPEASVSPIQPRTGKAWRNQTAVTLREFGIPSEGANLGDIGYLTASALQLPVADADADPPILNYKTFARDVSVKNLLDMLGGVSEVYQIDLNLPEVAVDPYILNKGSVALNVEETRITRLPVDWCYDSTGKRLLVLLSNPEGHIADLLVEARLGNLASGSGTERYRILHTFSKSVSVHRIARRDATNYYILTSGAISQDRSAAQLPRVSDKTGFTYDSRAQGSEIKIYRYDSAANTLTEHVSHTHTYRPQLGRHIWAGFENKLLTDEFEGIVAEDRGAFKVVGSDLYYRYANDSEFGVARVNSSGTVTKLIGQSVGVYSYWNHLNFAFDVVSNGDLYFVYATGNSHSAKLTIKKRTSGGVESTVYEDTQYLVGDIYLGCLEALVHGNYLYLLCPIQGADAGDKETATAQRLDVSIHVDDTGLTGEATLTSVGGSGFASARLPGTPIELQLNFNKSRSGLATDDFTVVGGTITSTSGAGTNTFRITISPSVTDKHSDIIITIRRNALTIGNERTVIILSYGRTRSRTKSGKMNLYRVDVTAQNPSVSVVEKWDYVQRGGCNLIVHENAVHFVEHSPALTRYKPVNPDLDGYWSDEAKTQTMGYNALPEPLGVLKRVKADGTVENLGNWRYEDRAWNVAQTCAISFDNELYCVMGYGPLDAVLKLNSLGSKADNCLMLKRTKKLQYQIADTQFSGSLYQAFLTLATLLNATVAIRNGIIEITQRSLVKALTDGATAMGTGNLSYENAEGVFPSSGYLRIGNEFLKYTGRTSEHFTGLQRGVLGTTVENHPDGTEILALANVVGPKSMVSGSPQLNSDVNRVHNVITNADALIRLTDAESIGKFGEKVYTLNIDKLTSHDLPQQEQIFKGYLKALKDLQFTVRMRLRSTTVVGLGDVMGVQYGDGQLLSVQIVSIDRSAEAIAVVGRTVPFVLPVFGAIASKTFNENGSRVINFTYRDNALQGNTTGVVRFYETATSETAITTVPGTSDALTSSSVAFGADGAGVATVGLPAVSATVQIYAEIHVTKGSAVEKSGRFAIAIQNVSAPSKIVGVTTLAGDRRIVYTIPLPAANGSPITATEVSSDGSTGWTAITPNADREWTLTGLDNGTAVTRYFRAVNAIGNGPASDAVVATPVEPDTMPSFGSATQADIVITRGTPFTAVTLPAAMAGNAPLTYSLSPNLPAGMAFDASTRQLSGDPTANLAETEFTLTVRDSDGDTDTLTFDLTVNPGVPAQYSNIMADAGNGEIVYTLMDPSDNGAAISSRQISADGNTWTNITVTNGQYTLSSLANGTPVTRYFRAVNSEGAGPASVAVVATPTAVLAWAAQVADRTYSAGTYDFSGDVFGTLPATTGGDGTAVTYNLTQTTIGSSFPVVTAFTFDATTRRITAGSLTASYVGDGLRFTYTAQQGSTTLTQTFTLTHT